MLLEKNLAVKSYLYLMNSLLLPKILLNLLSSSEIQTDLPILMHGMMVGKSENTINIARFILQMGINATQIVGSEIDTSFFNGNHAPYMFIEALYDKNSRSANKNGNNKFIKENASR